jgi:pimeloyl-ACP methyl ester carboxylesterase
LPLPARIENLHLVGRVDAATRATTRRRIMLSKIAWTVAAALCAYLGVVAVMFFMQRDFIYRPDAQVDNGAVLAAAGFEPLLIELPDGAVPALFVAPANGRDRKITILYFHGNAGAASRIVPKVKPLLDDGWGVALLEYPGYGGMPGEPEEQEIYRLARLALVEVARRSGGLGNVVLWGESLGAGVATAIASEQPVGGVILEAPFTSIADLARPRFPWLPVDALLLDRYDNFARIGRLQAPLLLAHGARDNVVPLEHGRRLFAAAPEPKRGLFYPQGGHNDLPAQGLTDEIIGFVRATQWAQR